MKQFISLSGHNLQCAVMLRGLSVTLLACSNKVDGYLNHLDGVVGEYEKKAEGNEFTFNDHIKMKQKLKAIEDDFRLKVGKDMDQWTDEQRTRAGRFSARMEKLEDAARSHRQAQRMQGL